MNKFLIVAIATLLLVGNKYAFARSELITVKTVTCLDEKVYTQAEILSNVNDSAKQEMLGLIQPDSYSVVQPYSFTEVLPENLHGLIKR